MSYARWGDTSDWYIYAHVTDNITRGGQLLAIWHVGDNNLPIYTYDELKNNRQSVWDDIASRVQPKQRQLFDACIDEFLSETEDDFPETLPNNNGSPSKEAPDVKPE